MAEMRRNLSAALGEEQYSELVACRRNPRNVWWLLSPFACHSVAEPKNLTDRLGHAPAENLWAN